MTVAEQTAESLRERQQDLDQPSNQYQPDQSSDVNVGRNERLISALCGGGMVVLGLRQRSLAGLAVAGLGGALLYRAATGHCHAYSVLGIDTADHGPAEPEEYFNRGIHVEHSVTINKPRAELFRFWRDFSNLPRFMNHLESVSCPDDRHSHWVAKGPAGKNVEWDAEIINEEPDALIAWRSLGDADVDNAGSVRFLDAPGDRGTVVKVVIDYIPPAGTVGKWVAKLFGEEPQQQVKDDLWRFKTLMETSEVPTTEGQPRGAGA